MCLEFYALINYVGKILTSQVTFKQKYYGDKKPQRGVMGDETKCLHPLGLTLMGMKHYRKIESVVIFYVSWVSWIFNDHVKEVKIGAIAWESLLVKNSMAECRDT